MKNQNWIDINDQIPEENEEVLCYNGVDFSVGFLQSYLLNYECIGTDTILENVTHWKYLIPPK